MDKVSAMNKPDLIDHMAAAMGNSQYEDVKEAVEIILASIMDSLASGERVEVRGFGAFGVRYHEPRIGRNPKTGEQVNIPGRYLPFFRPGKELREQVEEGKKRMSASK